MASKKAKGFRAKTRHKISKSLVRPTVTRLLDTFSNGEAVQIVINGSVHDGMPFRRFHGLTGKVVESQGGAVKVKVRQGDRWCDVIANPIHLKKIHQMQKEESKDSAANVQEMIE